MEDQTKAPESKSKKITEQKLSQAVQACLEENETSYLFLAGFATLLTADLPEGVMLYKEKKLKRQQAVELFKTALRVSQSLKLTFKE